MGEEGLEPPTDYLEGSCSIQLSYSPVLALYPNILWWYFSAVKCQTYEKIVLSAIEPVREIGNITLGKIGIFGIK